MSVTLRVGAFTAADRNHSLKRGAERPKRPVMRRRAFLRGLAAMLAACRVPRAASPRRRSVELDT